MWKTEVNLQESFLSFYHVGPKVGTQVIRLGSKHLWVLCHLSDPRNFKRQQNKECNRGLLPGSTVLAQLASTAAESPLPEAPAIVNTLQAGSVLTAQGSTGSLTFLIYLTPGTL